MNKDHYGFDGAEAELIFRLSKVIITYLNENHIPKRVGLCSLLNIWIDGELDEGEELEWIVETCRLIASEKIKFRLENNENVDL